eukprot:scaffold2873_cov55-Phaeocystis_antarctica.AAC.6
MGRRGTVKGLRQRRHAHVHVQACAGMSLPQPRLCASVVLGEHGDGAVERHGLLVHLRVDLGGEGAAVDVQEEVQRGVGRLERLQGGLKVERARDEHAHVHAHARAASALCHGLGLECAEDLGVGDRRGGRLLHLCSLCPELAHARGHLPPRPQLRPAPHHPREVRRASRRRRRRRLRLRLRPHRLEERRCAGVGGLGERARHAEQSSGRLLTE